MIYNGVAIANASPGTPKALSTTRMAARWVIVQAATLNTSPVAVGGAGGTQSVVGTAIVNPPVSATAPFCGAIVVPGGQVLFPAMGDTSPYDLQNIVFDVLTAGDKVTYSFGR